jgi:anti-anti-sigma factor
LEVNISTALTEGTAIIGIVGDLRIATVADAKAKLVAALAECGDMLIDLSAVDQCDTAGIQLLLMTCASARAKGKGFVTTGHTAAFRGALDRAGIPIECLEALPAVPDDGSGIGDRA